MHKGFHPKSNNLGAELWYLIPVQELLWKTKPLHELHHWQIEAVGDINTTYQWLENSLSPKYHAGHLDFF